MTGEEFLEKLATALGFDKYVFTPGPRGNGFMLKFCKGSKKYVFGYSTCDGHHWPFYVFGHSHPDLAQRFIGLVRMYSRLVLLGYLEDRNLEDRCQKDYAISTDARSLEEVLVQAELNAPSEI